MGQCEFKAPKDHVTFTPNYEKVNGLRSFTEMNTVTFMVQDVIEIVSKCWDWRS